MTKSLASTLAGVKETYRRQGVVVPFCLSRDTLTKSPASTLAGVGDLQKTRYCSPFLSEQGHFNQFSASTLAALSKFYRGYDVPIPFCLSRDL